VRLSRRTLLVAGLLLVALALRVTYVETTSYRAVNDAGTYNRFASTIATHGDYVTGEGPGTGAGGSRGPTAYFPPAFPYALAIADLLDGHRSGGPGALTGERLETAALGTVAVGLIGLVGLEAFGAAPGLAALGLAAIYPVLIELSGVLVAENLLIVFELAAAWAMLRARRAADGRRWGWLGGAGLATGLATLAHENAALMVIPLGFAAATTVGASGASRGVGRRLGAVAVLVGATAAMIVPWTVRNAIELHHFIPVSDETGITLRGAYNPESAADPIPYKWRLYFGIPQDRSIRRHAGAESEVALGAQLEHRALHYIDAHPTAPLSAGWDNLRRMFELEGSAAWHASARAIDLPADDARAGVISFWILCLLAIAGLGTRAVRAGPKWLWAIPVLFALSVVFVNVETPRFREPIDPFLLLLAGCAVVAVTRRASDATTYLVSAAVQRVRSAAR
jgi:4-amino-4-deoxy-L-arabinose transferase-like glycosyltransferase